MSNAALPNFLSVVVKISVGFFLARAHRFLDLIIQAVPQIRASLLTQGNYLLDGLDRLSQSKLAGRFWQNMNRTREDFQRSFLARFYQAARRQTVLNPRQHFFKRGTKILTEPGINHGIYFIFTLV